MKPTQRKAARCFLLFLLYALIGWIYEEVLEVFIYRTGFTNRGFLFGPYLPVYGCGALLFLVLLYPMKRARRFGRLTPAAVFLGCMAVATAVELVTSYGLSYFHLELWNYEEYAWNFQGRIALNPSIRFGLGGLWFLYGLQPLFERLLHRLSDRVLSGLACTLGAVLGADLLCTLLK